MPDGGDIIQGLTSTAENVLAPAAVGAGLGAGTAALTGGDPGQGALFGGATGGIGGGANWALGGANPITALFGGDATTSAAAGGDPSGVLSSGIGGEVTTQATSAAPGGGLSPSGGGLPAATAAGVNPTDFTQAPLSDATSGSADPAISGAAVPPQALAGKPDAPSGGGFLSDLLGKVKANPSALVSALGLGGAALGQGQTSQEKALLSQAQGLGATGQQLQTYLQGGGLPAGAQAGVTNATNAAKAAIRSKYASQGLSGSSMEVQDLANVDSQAAAQVFAMQDQLLKQGQDFSGLSAQLYEALIKNSSAQDSELMKALAGFAGSLGGAGGGGQGGTTIRIGGAGG